MFDTPVLHPIFVHFPIALLPVAVACDLLGRLTGRASLAHSGWWALLFATIATPFTAATGWYWVWTTGDMDHGQMRIHQWLGTALPFVLIPLAFWRYRTHMRGERCSIAFLAAGFQAVFVEVVGSLVEYVE